MAQEEPVVQIDERTFEVDAQLRVDEISEQLDLDLPEGEDYETMAGLVLYHLQRIPAEGEVLNCQDLRLEVTQMKGPKIEKVRVTRTA